MPEIFIALAANLGSKLLVLKMKTNKQTKNASKAVVIRYRAIDSFLEITEREIRKRSVRICPGYGLIAMKCHCNNSVLFLSNSPIQQPREITFTLNKPLRMNSVSSLDLSKYDTVRTVKMEIYNGFDVGQFAAMLKRMVIE